jgi:hypothetical protein
VLLYGSAVAGEHLSKRSDYNILVVLDSVPLDRLAAVGAVLRSWGESGNPPPMIFTRAEWNSSADVFPMEYADILERHRVLFGVDVTEGVSVETSDLRLEVEQQALGKLLHLRRAAMAAGDDAREQLKLLEDSLSTIMVIFRGVVRLHGDAPSQDYSALSGQVGQLAGFDLAPVARIIEHVRGTRKIEKKEAASVLAGYLGEMEALVAHLDGYTA